MSDRQMYIPPGGPPRIPGPSKEIYGLMGEANIFLMLDDFYKELVKSSIKEMFPRTEKMRQLAAYKSGAFFVGLMGGPPLYHTQFGPPRLRSRHFPFVIDEAGRLEWLACFDRILDQAVEKYEFPEQHLAGFQTFIHGFSTWMVNAKSEQ